MIHIDRQKNDQISANATEGLSPRECRYYKLKIFR